MTRPGYGGIGRVSVEDLEATCRQPGCGHQNAIHTGGGPKLDARDWRIYDRMWADASGSCSAPGCGCQGRR